MRDERRFAPTECVDTTKHTFLFIIYFFLSGFFSSHNFTLHCNAKEFEGFLLLALLLPMISHSLRRWIQHQKSTLFEMDCIAQNLISTSFGWASKLPNLLVFLSDMYQPQAFPLLPYKALTGADEMQIKQQFYRCGGNTFSFPRRTVSQLLLLLQPFLHHLCTCTVRLSALDEYLDLFHSSQRPNMSSSTVRPSFSSKSHLFVSIIHRSVTSSSAVQLPLAEFFPSPAIQIFLFCFWEILLYLRLNTWKYYSQYDFSCLNHSETLFLSRSNLSQPSSNQTSVPFLFY